MTDAGFVLFSAVLAQVVLIMILYIALVQARFTAAKAAPKPEMAYDPTAWPLKARLLGNSVTSQFELPVLFVAGVLFAFQFGATSWLMAGLAWLFVALRYVHAYIHTGKNVVIQRFRVFLAGFATLLIFWAFLAAHVFAAQATAR